MKNQETDGYGTDKRPEIEKLKKGNHDNWNWKKTETKKKNGKADTSNQSAGLTDVVLSVYELFQ